MSVTEQWADVAIAGPKARDVLAALGTNASSPPCVPVHDHDGAVAASSP